MAPSIVRALVFLACWLPLVVAAPGPRLSRITPRVVNELRTEPGALGASEQRSFAPKVKRSEEGASDTMLKEYPIDKRLKQYKAAGEEGSRRHVGSRPGYRVGYKPVRGAPRSDDCVFGPHNRGCWTGDFDIHTDMDLSWPTTGKTVKYYWEVTAMPLAPDGVPKNMQVINGQFPGPVLEAEWGDDVEVHVKNSLQTNGTGIHWHGVRQFQTNHMDGVGGVTECPIAYGDTRVYKFKATQYGSSWYHSHYSAQYGDGVVGGIVIRGPATSDYDIDLGFYPFMDWFHSSLFTVNAMALHAAGPPTADNYLVNGTHPSRLGGQYATTTLVPGKRHLLRLANTGINQYVHVSLDGHPFEVIAADFVPIVPYKTNSIAMTVGQRYDVIIDADQPIGNYWLRVETGGGKCDGPNVVAADGIRAIFRYEGSFGMPEEREVPAQPQGCSDETNLVPFVPTQVPTDTPSTLEIGFTNEGTDDNLVQWLVNGSRMAVDLGHPTLANIADGNLTFDSYENAYTMTKGKEWSYWVIQADSESGRVPHPIHLHGHDFYILDSAENSTWAGDTSRLKFDNPPRRDTATLPRLGYLILAFEADNPGAWLMHCHVPFHISAGFSMQFLEDHESIIDTVGEGAVETFRDACSKWETWEKEAFPNGFTKGDSLV